MGVQEVPFVFSGPFLDILPYIKPLKFKNNSIYMKLECILKNESLFRYSIEDRINLIFTCVTQYYEKHP